MMIRAGTVVTMDGPPIENGAVAVSGSRITNVGKFSEISKQHSTEEVVERDRCEVLPGLIHSDCDLDYKCIRGKIPRQESFTDWIRAINAEKAKLSPEDYVRSINEGFAEAKRFGTTTIANLTAFPELVSRIQAPIGTWCVDELMYQRDPSRANEIVDAAVETLKSAEHWGLAPHAPFTASANLYRRCQEVARLENALLTTHLAESREEMSMFRDASGPLYDFLKEICRDMADCGRKTPLSQLTEILRDVSTPLDMTESWMLVHLNELAKNDFDLFARSRNQFSIAHCPRSHAYFEHSPFQFERFCELGFNIGLGTDSYVATDFFQEIVER